MSLKTSLFVAALLVASASGHAQTAPADQAAFDEAQQQYRAGRWSAAYGRFVRLADRGHEDAARIAMVMLRHGRDLYGTEWSAAPSQVATWERAAGTSRPLQVVVLGE